MARLPDLEALAIFARVVELRSFSAAAEDLRLSKATVSKAVTRLETRLAARLLNRSSRRLALTDAGRRLVERAARILSEGEAAESDCLEQSASPRGGVRLAAPMSFGLRAVAPILPEFMQTYPEVLVDLHLSDALVDLVGEGFDAALRIGVLPDSALIARRLRPIRRFVVAAPAYLERRGRPTHPAQLAEHACFGYAYNQTADLWRFVNDRGEEATVRPEGPFRTTNGDAMMAPLLAGLGLAVLPEFIIEEALAEGRLETILTHWEIPSGALHLLTPPGGLRPARVSALSAFLIKKLAVGSQEVGTEP